MKIVRRRKPVSLGFAVVRVSREAGSVAVLVILSIFAVLGFGGISFDTYRLYRENIEQGRLARSVAVAAAKSYASAGCSYDWKNNNTGRVKFALTTAAASVNVAGHTPSSVNPVAQGGIWKLELTDSADGPTEAWAGIRLGAVSSVDSAILSPILPCVTTNSDLNNPTFVEGSRFVGIEVKLKGLSSTSRATWFARLVGLNRLLTSQSSTFLVYDTANTGVPLSFIPVTGK